MNLRFQYGVDQLTIAIALGIANGKIQGYLGPASVEKSRPVPMRFIKSSWMVVLFMVSIPVLVYWQIRPFPKKTPGRFNIKSCKVIVLEWVILSPRKLPNSC